VLSAASSQSQSPSDWALATNLNNVCPVPFLATKARHSSGALGWPAGSRIHRISFALGKNNLDPNCELDFDLHVGNTFQNLRVSSPAPVTIVCPSGDMARYRTR